MGEFAGIVIAQAATNVGMMTNFGRIIVQRLVEEGAEVHLFGSERPIFGEVADRADIEALGAAFHGLPLPQEFAPLSEFRSFVRLTRELRRLRVRLLHTRSSVMATLGRIGAKLARVPHVVNHQDDLHFRDSKHGLLARRFFMMFESTMSRLSERDFFVSQAVVNDAIGAGFRKDRCVMVGHDLHPTFQAAMAQADQTARTRHPLLGKHGVPDGNRVIGCVARLAHLKGIDTLIETAALVAPVRPDCTFFIRGDGPLYGPLQELVEKHRLQGRVILCRESIGAKELPLVYRSFDVFVLPTRREGFGMVFAEAMAMGVPVVGPRILPITEVVPEDCGILVEAENPQAYAGAILRLLDEAAFRTTLGSRAHEYAHRTWVGKQAAERVLDVYRELLFGRKRVT